MQRPFKKAIAAAAMLFASSLSAAHADLLNASYINTQPQPFGTLSLTMAKTYGGTKFNRFNIMGLTFCDPDASGCEVYNPVHWGDQPIMAYSTGTGGEGNWTAASPDAVAVVKALKAGGASVYASMVGGNTVPYLNALADDQGTAGAANCAENGPDVTKRACAAFYLTQAFAAYGVDGLDIDIESDWSSPPQYSGAEATAAFEILLSGLTDGGTAEPSFGMSFAPYYDSAADPVSASTTAGACVYKKYGITGYIDARQYYAGGTRGITLDSLYDDVDTLLSTLSGYPCTPEVSLDLATSQFVVGMSPYSVLGFEFPFRGGPNNCQYQYERGYPNCFEEIADMVAGYTSSNGATKPALGIGGSFVWTIQLIDPVYYACAMDVALNHPAKIGDLSKLCGTIAAPTYNDGACSQYPASASKAKNGDKCCAPNQSLTCTGWVPHAVNSSAGLTYYDQCTCDVR
ncbi:hypothetical protein [Roseibium sp.]|uniref:hypothetical protein n=1 Tax=Roseibium sp. TaxID=1936156 RepID=UPI003265A7C0